MTVLTQAIWDIASHPIVHNPPHQMVGIGSFMLRHGFGLLRSALKGGTPQGRILNGFIGSTLVGAGDYLIQQGKAHLGSIRQIASLFFPQNPSEKTLEGLHPFEESVKTHFGESFLHHNQSDSRPKVLWLTAAYDPNGALDPLRKCGILSRMRKKLDALTDLKFQVIGHPEQLCNAIQSGVKSGYLQNIFLSTHGSPTNIVLDPQKRIGILKSLHHGCFAGMPRNAKLFLSSCFGGSGLVPLNIAEWLAAESGLQVYASKDYADDLTTRLSISNQNEIDIDFCASDEPGWRACLLATNFKCEQSATRIFHPPVSLFEKSVFIAKMGLSALFGLFIAYELARLSLMSIGIIAIF